MLFHGDSYFPVSVEFCSQLVVSTSPQIKSETRNGKWTSPSQNFPIELVLYCSINIQLLPIYAPGSDISQVKAWIRLKDCFRLHWDWKSWTFALITIRLYAKEFNLKTPNFSIDSVSTLFQLDVFRNRKFQSKINFMQNHNQNVKR